MLDFNQIEIGTVVKHKVFGTYLLVTYVQAYDELALCSILNAKFVKDYKFVKEYNKKNQVDLSLLPQHDCYWFDLDINNIMEYERVCNYCFHLNPFSYYSEGKELSICLTFNDVTIGETVKIIKRDKLGIYYPYQVTSLDFPNKAALWVPLIYLHSINWDFLVEEKTSPCYHLNRRVVTYGAGKSYWYCPECKEDVGNIS